MDIVRHKHTLLSITESLTSLRAKGGGATPHPTAPRPLPLTTPKTCPTSDEVGRSALQCAEESCPEEVGSKGTSWPHFSEVFMLSALTSDGIDALKVSPFWPTIVGGALLYTLLCIASISVCMETLYAVLCVCFTIHSVMQYCITRLSFTQ